MANNPQLLFVAGPNGAGKSTFSKLLSEPDAVIFDVDKVIARLEAQSPDMPKKQIYQAATEEFFNQVNTAVRRSQHFTLETNFRDRQLVDIAAEFKRLGYTTNLIYLTLENIEQSRYRVSQRVKQGGHYVDQENIQKNYNQGLQYLLYFADRFDNLEIIDASRVFGQLSSLLKIQQKQIIYINDDPPEWIKPELNKLVDRFRTHDRRSGDDDETWNRGRGR